MEARRGGKIIRNVGGCLASLRIDGKNRKEKSQGGKNNV